ncbi:RES family NAD+ phosphorylase [Peribacillus sp. YIM B13482]|uniref:RES family NAD+ phosphorylase n=1 Tax=Peribacillus sp. YIM B13482 TaxID=3366298 RepID=UPI003671D970
MADDIDYDYLVKDLSKLWTVLKDDLSSGKVLYNDIEKLKSDYVFFSAFHDMFTKAVGYFEESLKDIFPMYRGANGKQSLTNYNRMIPTLEYSQKHNRMNPPGTVFLYLGINKQNNFHESITTCLKEIRAPHDSAATLCRFQITDFGRNKKVVDICGDSSIPKQTHELEQYIKKKCFDKTFRIINPIKLSKIITMLYFNIFSSDQIFKPVETDKQDIKKMEYAPFQAIANYIKEQGYAGMIYKSTVHKNGTNLVLFDTDYASVVPNSMKHVKVSDYL